MGLPMPDAVGGLRLSLSAENTYADVEGVIEALPDAVNSLRSLAPAR
jgi:cysteine sulfinate desulfinase/cysteine desulfurase-like protein